MFILIKYCVCVCVCLFISFMFVCQCADLLVGLLLFRSFVSRQLYLNDTQLECPAPSSIFTAANFSSIALNWKCPGSLDNFRCLGAGDPIK